MHCQIAKQFHKNKMLNSNYGIWFKELAFWSLGSLFSKCFWGCRICSRGILVNLSNCVVNVWTGRMCQDFARQENHCIFVEISNCALIWSSFWSFGFVHKAEEVLVHILGSWHPHPLQIVYFIIELWEGDEDARMWCLESQNSAAPKRFLLKHNTCKINMTRINPLVTHDFVTLHPCGLGVILQSRFIAKKWWHIRVIRKVSLCFDKFWVH